MSAQVPTCRWCSGTALECAKTPHESDLCPATVYGQANLVRAEQGLSPLTYAEAYARRPSAQRGAEGAPITEKEQVDG